MSTTITKQAETYLEALAKSLEIPPSRYEQAENSYNSLGDWLHRDESTVGRFEPEVYVQGSFRLGTVIKPQSQDEEYDIDCVCSLTSLSKTELTQHDLKELVGDEIKLYRESKGIKKEVTPKRRCWRLEYSDDAQFHMDIIPSVPNGSDQRRFLEERNLDARFADTAIAITDNEVLPAYFEQTNDWPRSNPRGYAEWFKRRMGDEFTRRRQVLLEEMRAEGVQASVEDIPTYRVRTPLQSAIMILKRHRDIMFADDTTDAPISIIITTLSAHAYNAEASIGTALLAVLTRMEDGIEIEDGKFIVRNPTDSTENFADKWEDHPERAEAFQNWLTQAREDFSTAARLAEHRRMSSILADRLGRDLTNAVGDEAMKLARSGGLLRPAAAVAAGGAPQVSFSDTPRTPKKPDGFA